MYEAYIKHKRCEAPSIWSNCTCSLAAWRILAWICPCASSISCQDMKWYEVFALFSTWQLQLFNTLATLEPSCSLEDCYEVPRNGEHAMFFYEKIRPAKGLKVRDELWHEDIQKTQKTCSLWINKDCMLRQKTPQQTWDSTYSLWFIWVGLFLGCGLTVATSSYTESFRDRPWVWVASCSWERNAQTVKNWKLIFSL